MFRIGTDLRRIKDVVITKPEDYVELMRKNYVIVDQNEENKLLSKKLY